MDFSKYTEGNRTERDCTVIALATAADIAYDIAHDIVAASGRKSGHGHYSDKVISEARKYFAIGRHTTKRCRASTFCKMHPTGRWYAHHRGHAFAIVDGVITDWTSPNAIVVRAWPVDPTLLTSAGK